MKVIVIQLLYKKNCIKNKKIKKTDNKLIKKINQQRKQGKNIK
jgi:hypothetical protein